MTAGEIEKSFESVTATGIEAQEIALKPLTDNLSIIVGKRHRPLPMVCRRPGRDMSPIDPYPSNEYESGE